MLCWHSSWFLTLQKPVVVVDAAVLHGPVTAAAMLSLRAQLQAVLLLAAPADAADAAELLAVQLLAAAADAADAAELQAAQHQHAAAAPAVPQSQPAAAVLRRQLLAAAAKVLRLQPQLLSALQSHQQLSSFCPYRENSTACDPLDRKPFCIGTCEFKERSFAPP